MNKLNVFYEKSLVGTLFRDDDLVYSFNYSDSWLKDKNAFQLSLAMPLQKESFGNKITLSFFENLLPEGEAREAIEKSQDTKSAFDFLKKFGKDCSGAIIVSDSFESPFDPVKKNELIEIDMKKVYQAIDEKRSVAEVIANLNPGYLSIAGAQDKFSAIVKESHFYLPTNGAPTTHIVKVPICRSGVKESVYNEYYCMKLAHLVGMNVPECFVLDNEKHPLYITTRYDRTVGKEIKRIHQQDFCQAQGIVSEHKYEAKGGPSLKDNYQLIKSHVTITKRSKALFDYLDWICFNLFIGNNDSHSKNISFLLNNGKIELAPFYDLLCTAIYPKLKRNFSFIIGDRDDASRVGKNQFQLVDESLGLKEGTMQLKAIEMSEKLMEHKDKWAIEVKKEIPSTKIVQRISELIGDRCKSIKRQGV
ncbi:MAG: hypothetical protein COW01_15540 [Bdellovibrionales bacterium CG12_big_fil_rev_8_21_14_0_65_38_15]|nr:MAG: hypothetical protein COW79_14705 [Bdellovibrionales bacterium CG22_combo_CG10-13_8_21_14_all_38_13]PIQ52384.1 MAG: hypothetical protein COW01_15540 [Bdellovibrionales bacterium CG12_big_fil_rev_8_21_14_0_65_38_15]PIR29423.1 MAG: hypothetical protein COV38_10080 [Bdellovibrionales bacterium CG11_big_fil_rev_8_21_14_0_20_38_13]